MENSDLSQDLNNKISVLHMCFHQVRENQMLNVVTVTSDNMMMLKSLFNAFEN